MFRPKIIFAALLSMAGAILMLTLAPHSVQAAPNDQSGELLTNPGFEADEKYEYPRIVTIDGGGAVAAGWSAWWYNDSGAAYSVPEYEVAPINRDPYRVHSGNAAQQLFRPSVLWKAGVYQQVTVPENAHLRFSAWGHAWSSFCVPPDGKAGDIDCTHYHDSYWGQANTAYMKVGIDPTGGTDWSSGNIVWSSEFNALDIYTNIAAEAQAQGTRVTVFTYTTFLWPAPVNNVYWDDASLVVIGEGSASAPSNNSTPGSNPPPPPASGPGRIAAQPPNADGSQHHIVKTGETLGGIAITYGVTSQELRTLNSINGDTIFVGQDLLIKEAAVQAPTPEVTPTVESTPEPTEVAEVAATGQICLALFEDANQDGLHDAAEPLLANGLLNIAGAATNAHTTDGIGEPFCFSDLPAGDYVITASAPAGYTLTSLPEVPVTISGGSEVSLSFGASALPPATEEAAASDAPPTTPTQPRSILLIVGGVLAVLTLVAGGGLAVYFLVYKRQTAKID